MAIARGWIEKALRYDVRILLILHNFNCFIFSFRSFCLAQQKQTATESRKKKYKNRNKCLNGKVCTGKPMEMGRGDVSANKEWIVTFSSHSHPPPHVRRLHTARVMMTINIYRESNCCNQIYDIQWRQTLTFSKYPTGKGWGHQNKIVIFLRKFTQNSLFCRANFVLSFVFMCDRCWFSTTTITVICRDYSLPFIWFYSLPFTHPFSRYRFHNNNLYGRDRDRAYSMLLMHAQLMSMLTSKWMVYCQCVGTFFLSQSQCEAQSPREQWTWFEQFSP